MKRKKFLQQLIWTGGVFSVSPLWLSAQQDQRPDALDRALVQKFVGAGHSDLETVQELLAETPTLLNAAHDWGGGDFETALGAASHVGRKNIVQFLLDQGAQANIFTACLFGDLEVVKAMLKWSPDQLHAKGPHGFTLLHHATRGGEEATAVKDFLESLGATETKVALY